METTISGFSTSFYIPAIQKLAFCLPHVRILGTNHCGELWRTAFKRRELLQDVLCRRDYSERVVASFANQIQSGYYGGNRYVYIEGIALEMFSAAPQTDINSSTLSRPRHAVFHSFYLMIGNRMLPLLLNTANDWYHQIKKSEILHAVDVKV